MRGGGCCPFLNVEFVRQWESISYSAVHTDFLDGSNVELSHSITELKKRTWVYKKIISTWLLYFSWSGSYSWKGHLKVRRHFSQWGFFVFLIFVDAQKLYAHEFGFSWVIHIDSLDERIPEKTDHVMIPLFMCLGWNNLELWPALQRKFQLNILIAHRHMHVDIGIEAVQFLFWKYFFRIFGIVSLQCGYRVFICLSSKWAPPPPRPPAVISREGWLAREGEWADLSGTSLSGPCCLLPSNGFAPYIFQHWDNTKFIDVRNLAQ
jgi:hypothetical protein